MAEVKEAKITIITGPGTEPIIVDTAEPITMAKVLKRANIVLKEGETPVVGEVLIENLEEMISPGQMIVIDSMPANG